MYKKIMVPLDGSELAEVVLPHVEAFIKGFDISDVILVRVLEPDTTSVQISKVQDIKKQATAHEYEKQKKDSAKEYLNQISERLKQEETLVHSEVFVGRVAESLIDYTDSNDIDIIIMASRGRSGITRWLMGSVADKLFRSASVPVFMVKATGI
ncbi:MAG: universal stress protein [Desulfotignum sp.]